MPNRTSAKEWLEKVYHDLSSAKILFDANHYTDVIGVDLHYAIEKALKSFLAYENKPIPKTHDLPKLYELVEGDIHIENEDILYVANKYHIEVSYPTFEKVLPPREEIKEVIDFTEDLLNRACEILNIDIEELK
ncbi:MAG: HEPN domain-containing protein [Epsilonproteobacteria bacterium]|nr:HEPN domain-containing protein [Campylobacterota bacterium]